MDSARVALRTDPIVESQWHRDGNRTRGCGYPRILNPVDAGAGLKFNPRVHPHPHPQYVGAGAGLEF